MYFFCEFIHDIDIQLILKKIICRLNPHFQIHDQESDRTRKCPPRPGKRCEEMAGTPGDRWGGGGGG